MNTVRRLRQLRGAIMRRGLDGLIVSNIINVRYLSGFSGSEGMMLVTDDLAARQEAHARDVSVSGTLGVLIGADILRLPAVRQLGAPLASVGGAGTFDGIFLTGIVAALLA